MRRSEGDRTPTGAERLRRRLGFDRNELRRRVDRVQWAVGLTLVAVFLLAAPLLAVGAGLRSYDFGLRAERHERATRWQVVATVSEPGVTKERHLYRSVQATWRAPDGSLRRGWLPAWKDARPGARQYIWVDGRGRLVLPPRPHSRTVVDAGYAAVGAGLAVGLPLLLGYLLVRRRCDRIRDALWEAEWARIDPHRIS